MVNYRGDLDAVFAALADPTRRKIVERLARGGSSVGALAAGFAISQPAVSKHIKVLEESGVLQRRVEGRVHFCTLRPQPMRRAAGWLERQERFWNGSLDKLERYLAEHPEDAP